MRARTEAIEQNYNLVLDAGGRTRVWLVHFAIIKYVTFSSSKVVYFLPSDPRYSELKCQSYGTAATNSELGVND